MNKLDKIDEIIYKSLNGLPISTQEQHELKLWISSDNQHRKTYDCMLMYWKQENQKVSEMEADAWEILDREISKGSVGNVQNTKKNKWYLKIAASFIVFLLAGVIFLLQNNILGDEAKKSEEQVVDVDNFILKENKKGIKSTLKLPDGTTVKLNTNSKLKIPKHFTNKERRVFLVGEAYFDVKEDAARPFVIETGEMEVLVKGTTFNVSAYPEKDKIEVAVETGTVSVKNEAQELLLTAFEAAVLHKPLNNLKVVAFSKDSFAWKDGVLIFRDTKIEELLRRIEDWYGVEFKIKKNIQMVENITATFEDLPLKTVLESISYTADFNYKIDNNVVTIY